MKILSLIELRKLDEKKLNDLILSVSRQLLESSMQHSQQQLKDTSFLPKLRRYRARLYTVRQEKELHLNHKAAVSSS